jgi:Tol biopolymer transport system component
MIRGDQEACGTRFGLSLYRSSFFQNGQKLLFLSSSYKDELKQAIYIMNVDGTGIKRLTPENELVTEAVISPNGKRIYYIKAAEFYGEHPGVAEVPHGYDLFSIEIDGSNNRRITNFSTEFMLDLSISHDGDKIGMILDPFDENKNRINVNIKHSTDEVEYVIYDINSKEFTALQVPLSAGLYETVPVLSPGGNKVVFANDKIEDDYYFDYELSEMDLETKKITPLSSLDIISKAYADDKTLYIIYDKDKKEDKMDLKLAEINSEEIEFTDLFRFTEKMK